MWVAFSFLLRRCCWWWWWWWFDFVLFLVFGLFRFFVYREYPYAFGSQQQRIAKKSPKKMFRYIWKMMAEMESLWRGILKKTTTKNASVKEMCKFSIQTGVTIISDNRQKKMPNGKTLSLASFPVLSFFRLLLVFSFSSFSVRIFFYVALTRSCWRGMCVFKIIVFVLEQCSCHYHISTEEICRVKINFLMRVKCMWWAIGLDGNVLFLYVHCSDTNMFVCVCVCAL